MKTIFSYLLILVVITGVFAQEHKQFYQMTNDEINDVIIKTSKTNLTITEKMNQLSELFLGMPYNFKCVGDGPYALMEPYPLVNFKETNCMSFCEHVLALSISDSWDNFFNNLQHIRYKDGLIGMKTRNHYTMADWLPQNSWLLEDAANEVATEHTKSVTRTISHQKFFAAKGMTDMSHVLPDRTIKVNYVPMDVLDQVQDKLKTGDILALLFADKDDIFSAHMLMVVQRDGKKIIRESSNSKMSTFDTPIQEWIKAKQEMNPQKYLGVAVMRVREELNTPGKIIQPWEIEGLKGNN
jgi:hypothetical protein